MMFSPMNAVTFHIGSPVVAAAPISPISPTHMAAISKTLWTILVICNSRSGMWQHKADLPIWSPVTTVRGGLFWERITVVTSLVQSDRGKEECCLFCVYGSSFLTMEWHIFAIIFLQYTETRIKAHKFGFSQLSPMFLIILFAFLRTYDCIL